MVPSFHMPDFHLFLHRKYERASSKHILYFKNWYPVSSTKTGPLT